MEKEFLGYARPDGSAGIRNHVLVLPVQRQMNIVAKKISETVPGTRTLIYPGELGRPRNDRLVIYRTLTGLGLNPNTASVLVIGSRRQAGYDELKPDLIIGTISASGKRVEVLMLAEEDGFYNALGRGIKIARDMVREASRTLRTPFGLEHLMLGVKCGMSDSTSAICGNPTVGKVFDALIGAGGRAVFSETTEVIGAEHILAKRARNAKVAGKLLEAVKRTEEKAKLTGEDIRKTNPIPENIAGGLTTLEEKSLGAIVKAGTAPVEDVIQYAEQITKPGLYFMDAWMSSLSLPTGYAASGAHLFLYQMGGQGVPGREFPAPAVSSGVVIPIMYLTGNSKTYERACDTIDFSSGSVLDDLETLDEAADRLLNEILTVASGARTKAETIRFDDPIELYLQGPSL
ncbi:MAG: D-galactarate dehydratase [Desulfobacteraceae bacterium]|nr:MAG: D-galactarate dehydratase [Desulfobacteraceae bacterium]